MADVGDILNYDEFFGDVADTPKEGIEQHRKREYLMGAIDKGRLGHKWTHKKVDKASDEIINKVYAAEYRQRELNEKCEKTGKAPGKHVIELYCTSISRWLKIKDVTKLRQDIDNDPIIYDQMASLGCLLECTFGNLFAPVLVAAYTVNNLDLSDEQDENEVVMKVTIGLMMIIVFLNGTMVIKNLRLKELIHVTWYPSRWWDCCVPKDDKKK